MPTRTTRALRAALPHALRALALALTPALTLTPLARAEAPASPKGEARAWLGSYGRVGISSDLEGGQGAARAITPYAPRLIEDNYLEIDAGYHAYQGSDATVDIVTTIAALDALMHYSGVPEARLALRRAFVEARDLWGTPLWLSLGSRWLRGDDIYLMNFWPLDDLNTLGLTAGARGARFDSFLHVGVSRLERSALAPQSQRALVPAASGFGAEEAQLLNRQRLVIAAMYERRYGGGEGMGWKWKLYGELHALPSGARLLEGSYTERERLADDRGLIIGAQVGLWSMRHKRDYLNLWLRYARGLAIYDELGAPGSLSPDLRAWPAEEWRAALAGNHEWGKVSAQWGAYIRQYTDADATSRDFDDRTEGSVALRPQLNLGLLTPALELSAQASAPAGPHPRTLSPSTAVIYQAALIPAITLGDPAEMGPFTRPQLRLIYAISSLNAAARARYAEADPRAQSSTSHYLGARAEWWFGRGERY
jgi:hypothetical protein